MNYCRFDTVVNSNPIDQFKAHGIDLGHTPDVYITLDVCYYAVKHNGENIRFVPPRFLTHDIIAEAIKTTPRAARHIPAHITPEMWYELVGKDGTVLEYVPHHLKTSDLCLRAVEQNPMALTYAVQTQSLVNNVLYTYFDLVKNKIQPQLKPVFADRMRRYEFSIIDVDRSILRDPTYVSRMSPEHLKWIDPQLLARPEVFLNIPDSCKTPYLCELAVKTRYTSLFQIPEHLLTTHLVELAIEQCPESVRIMSRQELEHRITSKCEAVQPESEAASQTLKLVGTEEEEARRAIHNQLIVSCDETVAKINM